MKIQSALAIAAFGVMPLLPGTATHVASDAPGAKKIISTGTLGGLTLYNRTRSRLGNVEIQIFNLATGEAWTTVSAVSGMFELRMIPVGKYRVIFHKTKFEDLVLDAEVLTNKQTSLIVVMQPAKALTGQEPRQGPEGPEGPAD